jgi:hypothetical protein
MTACVHTGALPALIRNRYCSSVECKLANDAMHQQQQLLVPHCESTMYSTHKLAAKRLNTLQVVSDNVARLTQEG